MEISLLNIVMLHIFKHEVIFWPSERYGRKHLCISSSEKSRTMYSWEIVRFTEKRSNIFDLSVVNSLSCGEGSASDETFHRIENCHLDLTFCVAASRASFSY